MRALASVSKAVERLVELMPCVKDMLAEGVVNYTKLARRLRPAVESELGGEVSEASVKLALIRLSRRLSPRLSLERIEDVLARSTVELKTGLSIITFDRAAYSGLPSIVELASAARFFTLTQGVSQLTFIVDRELAPRLLEAVGRGPLHMIDDVSAVVLVSPPENVEVPGFVAYVSSVLASAGINLVQIVSSYSDTILVVAREDAVRAFETLYRLIEALRRGPSSGGPRGPPSSRQG
ncbi:MAG: ACT domain-containing protein [Desulfurococcaceae archaeon]